MARRKTYLDSQIEPAIEKVVRKSGASYFTKKDVVDQIKKVRKVSSLLDDLQRRHAGVGADEIVLRYIETAVGQALQKKDANGLRVYECYSAGERQRRWMRLRAMTAEQLRVAMQAADRGARELQLKAEGYQLILNELEKGPPGATVDDVYDEVVPRILEHRASA